MVRSVSRRGSNISFNQKIALQLIMECRTKRLLWIALIILQPISTFVFFSVFDADAVSFRTAVLFYTFITYPLALFVSAIAPDKIIISAPLLVIGTVLSTLLSFIFPSIESNIFPISVFVWTCLFSVPLFFGIGSGIFLRTVQKRLKSQP